MKTLVPGGQLRGLEEYSQNKSLGIEGQHMPVEY